MVKLEDALSALQKLYAQRDALNKQIVSAEKKLIAEAKASAKTGKAATNPAGKTAGRPAKKAAAAKPQQK